MKFLLSGITLLALLSGCAPLMRQDVPATVSADAADEAEVSTAGLPRLALTPRWMNNMLLAEIAGQRGYWAQAAELYLVLALETRDPRIARRATEMALHSRQLDTALQSARIWRETDPASTRARQAYIGLLAAQGRYDELKPAVAALLADEKPQLPQNLLSLNRLFARGGDRQAIRALIDEVTAPYSHLAEAHFSRAVAAAEANDKNAARAETRRTLELRPDWDAAVLLSAQLADNHGDAMATLARFLADHPQAREIRLAYARALTKDQRYAEARQEFATLLEREPNDADLVFAVAMLSLQLNDTRDAEKHLRHLVETDHAEIDKARLFLGQIAEDGQRWDEALRWFDAVRHGEHYASARLRAASVLAKQGQLEAARRHLAASTPATPQEQTQLAIGEAQLLREAGRLPDAHAALAAALAKQPDQPELLYEIALLAEKLGRIDELESRLRRLIEIKPDHAHALNALGYSFVERNIRLPEARTLIERALVLAPNDPFILDSQGWLLFRMGDTRAAAEALDRAFGLRDDPEIAAHLGEVLWSLNRKEEARGIWNKAVQANPANEVLLETIKRLAH